MLQYRKSSFTHILLITICVISGLLTSCKDKVICPAYQSVYLHDPAAQERLFYPFDKDTLPVDYSVNVEKTRYGIMKLEPYKKKVRSLQTVEMEYVYPAPDSAEVELLAYHELDSAQRDSVEAGIRARKYADAFRYNRDMKIYMEEVGQYQMDPKEEEQETDEFGDYVDEMNESPEEEAEPKKKKGFFKRLFGGKKKKKKEEEVILEEEGEGDPYELDYYKDQDENEEEEEEKESTTEEIGIF